MAREELLASIAFYGELTFGVFGILRPRRLIEVGPAIFGSSAWRG
jgi:hypothetical protein